MTRVDEHQVPFRSDLREGVLHLSGELEGESSGYLDAALHQAVRQIEGDVAIDLSAVTFCGSAGLACLIRAKAAAGDRPVVLLGATAVLRRLLTITGLVDVFVLVDHSTGT